MNIDLEPGSYIVAVSGGVDSVVLLHVLQAVPNSTFIVAHYDHGIRPDSRIDRLHVQKLARQYGLPFVFDEGHLGNGTSEALAREARYDFLHTARKAAGADAVVTAHHKDDLVETVIVNIIRGTGRLGLGGVKNTDIVKRPFLHVTKADILAHANKHQLQWREDSTNTDTNYLRNHIRHKVIPRLQDDAAHTLHVLATDTQRLNQDIDHALSAYLHAHANKGRLDARSFILLPHAVAREVMAAWLRQHGIRSFDKKMLERLAHAAKIHKVGREVPINKTTVLRIYENYLALEPRER